MAAPALSFPQKLRYGAEAALFLTFMGFFRLIGVDAASAVGGFIGRAIFARTGVTRRARDNLIAAFPEKSEAEREAIIRTMWDNLGRTVAEYAHLDKFDLGGPDPRIQVNNLDVIEKVQGKGVLIVSGHFANWEIMPIAASRYGMDGAIVYRPPNNPYVDRYIARARARKGYAEQISKHQGTRRIFTLLRGGKAILLLADQKTNEGIAVPFFGRDAMTTPAPAALALKLKVPMIFASNKRLGGARFAVTVYPPLEFTPTGNDDADMRAMTEAINLRLEEMVRADPGQWLWIHRRWPSARDVTTSKRL
jgi:KDO2-lipid IV(A) lauroyltransferase